MICINSSNHDNMSAIVLLEVVHSLLNSSCLSCKSTVADLSFSVLATWANSLIVSGLLFFKSEKFSDIFFKKSSSENLFFALLSFVSSVDFGHKYSRDRFSLLCWKEQSYPWRPATFRSRHDQRQIFGSHPLHNRLIQLPVLVKQ